MSKIKYIDHKFKRESLSRIAQANDIIADYEGQGFRLTLRQLFYQFVSKNWIENSEKSYDRLGELISNARLAGLIDWNAIEDRTRNLRGNTQWNSPSHIINSVKGSYKIDMWYNQPVRPEVWIEKDALVGVIDRVCRELDVDFFACRGYTSQSEQHVAANRIISRRRQEGQETHILYLGDHDPSGVDMTRDHTDRLKLFSTSFHEDLFPDGVLVDRLALNMDQIRAFNPPPNPTKQTDSRCVGYEKLYGKEGWELDAMRPGDIANLARESILLRRDPDAYAEAEARLAAEKERVSAMIAVAVSWDAAGVINPQDTARPTHTNTDGPDGDDEEGDEE